MEKIDIPWKLLYLEHIRMYTCMCTCTCICICMCIILYFVYCGCVMWICVCAHAQKYLNRFYDFLIINIYSIQNYSRSDINLLDDQQKNFLTSLHISKIEIIIIMLELNLKSTYLAVTENYSTPSGKEKKKITPAFKKLCVEGHLGGILGWASDSWFHWRSWSWSSGNEPVWGSVRTLLGIVSFSPSASPLPLK